MKRVVKFAAAAFAAVTLSTTALADPVPVSLELYLAADVSGSITPTDFDLQRQGFAAAFQSAAVQSAIVASGTGIAVKLVDFANSVVTAVDWYFISNAAEADAFAALILAAPRGAAGGSDGQSNMINAALADMNGNNYTGLRQVLDIASEGAQDIDGCTFNNVVCPTVQAARDNFLGNGGTTINAIWLQDRTFFGLNPGDTINAFQYGSTNVIGGPGNFQVFAADFTAFAGAIERKIEREIRGVPEPSALALVVLGLAAAGVARRRKAA
jgi:hypothetical protein